MDNSNYIPPHFPTTEVLVNGDARSGLQDGVWQILSNGGDGWAVENGPAASCPATLGGANFATSSQICSKAQEIVLMDEGFSAEELDRAPLIRVTDWIIAPANTECRYGIAVELRDANQNVLKNMRRGTFLCPCHRTRSPRGLQ